MKWKMLLFMTGILCTSILAGCDSGDDGDNPADEYFDAVTLNRDARPGDPRKVAITPESANLTFNGESVIFNAEGGEGGYRWEVQFPALGDLEVRGSSQARYTRTAEGENMIIVYSGGYAAVARINQSAVPVLVVSPASATLTVDGAAQTLSASGGTPPYTWSVQSGPVAVSPSTGGSTSVTRSGTGTAVVRVTDADGSIATATIELPAPAP